MLMLAGLMGMMALGATVYAGIGVDEEEEDRPDQDLPDAGVEDAKAAKAAKAGTSILDFIGRDPDTAASAIRPPDAGTVTAEGTGQDAADSLPPTVGPLPDMNMIAGTVAGAEALPDERAETAERVTVGTSGGDKMDGSDAVDVANGHDGDDAMTGAKGGDALWGGAGADTLSGDTGDDTLHGGAGDDIMQGGDGNDLMFGHGDDDTMLGGADNDSLVGGDGDDVLDGGPGADALHGNQGDDLLRGGDGHDILFGGWGNDTLSGFEDEDDSDGWDDTDVMDYLNGGGGDDLITAGAGDIITGGAGADTVLLGEWLSADHQAQILDFAPDEDMLMVVYDDLADPEPEVGLAPDPDDESIRHVMLNGIAVAVVNNAPGLNTGHIALIGSSLLPAGALL